MFKRSQASDTARFRKSATLTCAVWNCLWPSPDLTCLVRTFTAWVYCSTALLLVQGILLKTMAFQLPAATLLLLLVVSTVGGARLVADSDAGTKKPKSGCGRPIVGPVCIDDGESPLMPAITSCKWCRWRTTPGTPRSSRSGAPPPLLKLSQQNQLATIRSRRQLLLILGARCS